MTMAAHADAFPAVWAGVWSGPDGLQGTGGDRPGEAWYGPVTPMTDFPVQNNNQHAMPLFAALRLAGVEATAAALRVAPHVPGDFAMRAELVDVSRRGSALTIAYRPRSARSMEVAAPTGTRIASATAGSAAIPVTPGAASVVAEIPAGGAEVRVALE